MKSTDVPDLQALVGVVGQWAALVESAGWELNGITVSTPDQITVNLHHVGADWTIEVP
jgi:hypothetical protein